jgi:hypothetical protein
MSSPPSVPRAFAAVLLLAWCGAASANVGSAASGVGPATPAVDSGPYEHVTITVGSFAPSFDSLKTFLHENLSLHDTIILTDSIYSRESGRDNPEKIRNFIRYAYQNWQTSYVLLGGDVEHVPTRKTYVGLNPSDPWWDTIATDQYYSCLDGTWDADSNSVFGEMHDSVDLAPEVYVGRAPVSTIEEADRFVTKTLTYSRGGTPRREVFLAGFDLDSAAHGEQTMEYYDSACIVSPFSCAKVYDSHGGNHRDSVLYYLNQGFHYCIYAEHGSEFGIGAGFWSHGYNIWNADIIGLSNGFDKLTVFISSACLIGAFDCYTFSDDCFMEYFINDTDGGGVAAMTNSRFGWYTRWENPPVSRSFAFISKFVDRIFSDGRDTAVAREFTLGKADLIGPSVEDTVYRWCMYTLNLLGEPALKMVSRDGVQEPVAGPRTRHDGLVARPAVFSRLTTIEYGVGSTRNVMLGVYDAGGRCVRTISSGRLTPGRHEATWDGRTDLGRDAPAGVYVVALKTEAGISTRKVVLCNGKEQQ